MKNDVKITHSEIINKIINNYEKNNNEIPCEIEVIIPASLHCKYLDNINNPSVIERNNTIFNIYDDFYSFKGVPNTEEAKDYLRNFDKIEIDFISDAKFHKFSVWYRSL